MIKKIKSPFSKEVYVKNAQVYKAMSNNRRLEILNILAIGERTVQELSHIIGITKSNTSQHLTVLRHLKLVNVRRNRQNSHYSLVDKRLVSLCKVLHEIYFT